MAGGFVVSIAAWHMRFRFHEGISVGPALRDKQNMSSAQARSLSIPVLRM